MATTKTTNLELRYIQPTDYFISDTFNNILDDIDSKVVGVSHLSSGAHWDVWKEKTDYVTGDIIRTPYLHSNQYLECSQSGKSGTIEPQVNVTGTEFTDGTAEWVVKVIGATDEKTVSIWLAGENYLRGSLVLYNNKLFRCKVPHQSIKFDTDYSKWQEVYASISPWESSKYYAVGDAVIKDNLLYECITANTDITFTEVNWKIVGSISIIEDWTKETDYKENQVARYRGKLYRANTRHTSGATFNDNDWTEIFANIPQWKANEQYTVDNVVQKDNIMYICVNSHVSSVFADDIANWTIFHKPIANIPSWIQDTYYEVGQVVEKGGIIYRCKTTNSDNAFTEAKWEVLVKAIVDWKSGDSYQIGQYVNYSGSLYKCITPNNDSTFTASKWQKIGGSGLDEWKESTIYSVGDYAVYGNLIYKCVKAHTSTAKFIDDFGDGDWVEISASIPEWKANEQYIVGNVVEKGGIVYRCIISNADTTFTLSNWQKISSNGLGYWETNTAYTINDVVYYSGGYYVCITSHTSANDFQTDYDSTAPKWYRMDSHIDSYKNNTFYGKGVTVEYNNKIYKCLTSYTSTSEKMDKVGSAISSATATRSAYTDSWGSGTSNKRLEVMRASVFTVGTSHYMGTVAVYGSFNAGNHVFNVYGGSSSSNVNTLVKTFTFSPTSNLTNYSLEIPFEANFGYYAINVASATASGSTGNIAWYESSMNKWELIGEANEKVHALNKWVSGYSYEVNDVVRYANDYYVCLVAHTSSAFETNYESKYWYKLNSHINAYTASTYYAKGSTIEFNNKIYECITSHTSPASGDMAKGSTLSSSSAPTGVYKFNYGASVNNAIVEVYNVTTLASGGKKLGVFRISCDLNAGTHKFAVYGGSSSNTATHELVKEQTYTCSEYVASAQVDIDCEANFAYYHVKVVSATASGKIYGISMYESTYPNWKLIGEPNGRKAVTVWKDNTDYFIDDIVLFDDVPYICTIDHTSSSSFATDTSKWDLLYSNVREYANNTFYKLGSIVKRGGQVYECIKEHTTSSAGFGVGELYNGSGYLSHSLHSGSFSEVTTHTFDLGAQYDIYSIYFIQGGGYAGIRGIRFEYSVNGIDFETVYDWADPTAREGTESTVTIPTEIKPRYIKLTTTDTWHGPESSSGVSIDKLIIRGYQNYWRNLSGYANWQQNFIYDSNDIVNYENDLYCCKVAHTSDSTFTEDNWEPMTALATEQAIKDMWL